MHRWPRQAVLIAALVIFCACLTGRQPRALAQADGSAQITSPVTGDPLFGLVSIQGTASNPNMQRYLLEFDSQDDDVERFFPIAGPITQQVKNGVLGQWNTTLVPDGRYQIRLRVVLRDGTVLSTIVQDLRVSNKQPTPLPTTLPSATPVPPTLPPTAGPSPTPVIQQPPTSTIRPAAPAVVPSIQPEATAIQAGAPLVVAFDALQSAFCSGVYLAVAAFILLGIYAMLSRRFRPAVRRFMRQMRR